MARRRDYKAEYRRRIEREQTRAKRLGVPFSRSRARGHAAAGTPSAVELRTGVLGRSTLDAMHRINLERLQRGEKPTIGNVPPDLINRLDKKTRNYFFGY